MRSKKKQLIHKRGEIRKFEYAEMNEVKDYKYLKNA